MYLSKYLAVCGVCSRRQATQLVKDGRVYVNDKIETQPNYFVKPGDEVIYDGEIIISQKKVYVLLNKPKNYVTTRSDEKGRKTVLDLINLKNDLKIYPVGRLDRETTGLLLLTNDGDLAYKLSHPKFKIEKRYRVLLDKNLTKKDIERLLIGFKLYDGFTKFDHVYFDQQKSKKDVIVQLHSGKNRIIRRMFKHLGYDVKKLDRIFYAGLQKKGLLVGKWRFLSKQEVEALQGL
ncbi:MAG: pseudouridine synthase [bacterium]